MPPENDGPLTPPDQASPELDTSLAASVPPAAPASLPSVAGAAVAVVDAPPAATPQTEAMGDTVEDAAAEVDPEVEADIEVEEDVPVAPAPRPPARLTPPPMPALPTTPPRASTLTPMAVRAVPPPPPTSRRTLTPMAVDAVAPPPSPTGTSPGRNLTPMATPAVPPAHGTPRGVTSVGGGSPPGGAEGSSHAPPPVPATAPPSPHVGKTGVRADAALAALAAEGVTERLALLERELALEEDKDRRALIEHEIGELLEFASHDEAAAVRRYSKAILSDPSLRPNLWALRRVCERRGLWQNLIKLLVAETSFARDNLERAELWVERGVVLADRLDDAAGARAAFEQAVALVPTYLPALMALEKVATREGDVAALIDIYRRSADGTSDPARKVALLIDLARLIESRPAVEGEASSPVGDAMVVLREAHAVGVHERRVLDEMERIAEASGKPEELLAALDLRAAVLEKAARQDPLAAEQIAAIRRRQARAVRPTDAGRAWSYLEQARALVPDEPLLFADLCELAESEGRHADLAALCKQLVGMVPAAARAHVLFTQARALRRAGRPIDAATVELELDRATEGGAAHWPLLLSRQLRALEVNDLAGLAGRYLEEGELALAGKTPTGVADPQWAAAAFTRAGALYDANESDGEAVEAYQRALAAVPGYRVALDGLEHRHAKMGRHAERARLLEQQLDGADPARAEYLLEELVELRLGQVNDTDGAIRAAESLAALRSGDLRSRLRLVDLCRSAGRWRDAVAQLERVAEQLAQRGAMDRAIDAKLEQAAIHEQHLGEIDVALALYDEVLRAAPGHPQALGELKRLHNAGGRHADVARVLERELESTLDPERIARVLVDLGDLYDRHLDKPRDAARVYRDLLDRSPAHPTALRALARAHDRAGDASGLAQVIESAAEAATTPTGKAVELLALGEIYEDRLHDNDLAEGAFARSLEQSPSPHAALGRLRALIRRRDARLVETTLGDLAGDADATARAALSEERAWLLAGPCDDLDAAEKLLATDAATSPRLLGADVARARLAARKGEVGGLAAALRTVAAQVTDAATAAAFEMRAAVLAAAAGGEARTGALAALERAGEDAEVLVGAAELCDEPTALARRRDLAVGASRLDLAIAHIEALEARGRLVEAAAAVAAALASAPEDLSLLDAQRRIARAGGDRLGQARATAQMASVICEKDRSAERFAEAARMLAALGQDADAAIAWRAVLARRPLDDEAYQAAHHALQVLDDPGALDELLTERLAHVSDGKARVPLLLERAELRRATGQPRRAMDDLRTALDAEPTQVVALAQLAQLEAEDGDVAAAIRLYDRFTESASDPVELRRAHLRLAELHEEVGEVPHAVDALKRVLVYAPDDREAIERLAALYLTQGDHLGAIAQLRTLARAAESKERVRIEQRVADVYQTGLGDGRGARDALARALDEEPTHLEILARLVPLCEAQGELQLKDSVLARAAAGARASVEADARQAEPYRALERIYAWQLDEDQRAFASQAAAIAAGETPPGRTGGVEPTRELSSAGWDRVFPVAARGLPLELWRETQEAASKILGADLAALGVGKNERQNAKGIPLAWVPVDKIARALGVASYELYLSSREREVAALAGPALVLGGAHADRLSPATRFRVTRKLALLKDRLGPLETQSDAELELYFAACARAAGTSWAAPSRPVEARVDERSKLIGKILDRRAKKALQSLAPRFASLGDVVAWRKAVLHGASLLALAVAGDLGVALGELKLTLADEEGQRLARFAISEEMPLLRRELGLRG